MGTYGILSPVSLLPIAIGVAALIAIAFARWVFSGKRRAADAPTESEDTTAMETETRKSTDSIPAPVKDVVAPESGWEAGERQTAVFAGGCFWGVQSVFQRVRGVTATVVGYTGGSKHTAIYRAVCSMETGHAEAIEITFDPSVVTYGTLLRIFFSVVHDPTQVNRQGNDVGTQYRSAIFFTTPEQEEVALAYIAQLDAAHVFPAKIATEVTPLIEFFPGEEYHQDYAVKNPDNPYIQMCDLPKIAELERQFPEVFQQYTLPA